MTLPSNYIKEKLPHDKKLENYDLYILELQNMTAAGTKIALLPFPVNQGILPGMYFGLKWSEKINSASRRILYFLDF